MHRRNFVCDTSFFKLEFAFFQANFLWGAARPPKARGPCYRSYIANPTLGSVISHVPVEQRLMRIGRNFYGLSFLVLWF